MTGPDDEVLLARAYLSRVGEPASIGLWRYVQAVGPVQAMREIRGERAWPSLLSETASRRGEADPHADLAAAERHGVRLVVPESAEWPHFALGVPRAGGASGRGCTRRATISAQRVG